MYRPEGMKKNPYPNEVDWPLLPSVAMADIQTMMHRAYEDGATAMHEADVAWFEKRLAPRYSGEGKELDGWYLADEVWQFFKEIE